ncbi:magnesium/cobalt transporter CorA [soil metagenome]
MPSDPEPKTVEIPPPSAGVVEAEVPEPRPRTDGESGDALAEDRIEQLNRLRGTRDNRIPAHPPGTLRYVGDRPDSGTRFRIIDFDRLGCRELECSTADECCAFESSESPTWIQVIGLGDTQKLGEMLGAYGVHPLIQDDVVNTRHSPKAEDLGTYLFVTAREISYVATTDRIEVEHFALITLPNVVITFHERMPELLEPVVERIRTSTGRLRKSGSDYLTWAILDALVDHYLLVLDEMESEANRLDNQLIRDSRQVEIGEIHAFKQEASYLCRLMRPTREVIGNLRRSTSKLLTKRSRAYFGDLYDHAVHATESAEHLRETAAGLRDFHMAVLSSRMNAVMKVLTSIATIFMPLTFIAGVYGMNFDHMPELHLAWAYPALWGIFLAVSVGMIVYFRRKDWL